MKPQVYQLLRMSPEISIKEGALFIADAHDSATRTFFFEFLQQCLKNPPPQLFLMGDMFDLLVGNVAYGVRQYQPYIALIEQIADRCEVFYFEGNHDFNLAPLFPHVRVFSIEQQPLHVSFPDGSKGLLLHGDKYGDAIHRTYTSIIRNTSVLWVLDKLDRLMKGAISKAIQNDQCRKNLCRNIHEFEAMIAHKLPQYPCEGIKWIAEGHYHQGNTFVMNNVKYFNFESFACNQSYFTVQSSQKTQFARMQVRGCNG